MGVGSEVGRRVVAESASSRASSSLTMHHPCNFNLLPDLHSGLNLSSSPTCHLSLTKSP